MSRHIVVLIMFSLTLISHSYAQEPDPVRDFVEDVNEAWISTNYIQLLQVINNRLAQNSNDLLALCVKQSYYLNCEFDVSQAQATVLTITNIIYQSGVTNKLDLFEEQNNLILSMPTNLVASYTPEKTACIHREFGDKFPGLIEAIGIAIECGLISTNSP